MSILWKPFPHFYHENDESCKFIINKTLVSERNQGFELMCLISVRAKAKTRETVYFSSLCNDILPKNTCSMYWRCVDCQLNLQTGFNPSLKGVAEATCHTSATTVACYSATDPLLEIKRLQACPKFWGHKNVSINNEPNRAQATGFS